MRTFLKVLLHKLVGSFAKKEGHPMDEPQEERVAYRLGYGAGLEWKDQEYAKLEAFRNRASMFLSATVVASGAGIGVSGVAASGVERGCLTWFGVLAVAVGFTACLAAAIGLMRPLKAPFEISPKTLVKEYGDNIVSYPTDDATYRALALWSECKCIELTNTVKRRCQWLNLSMGGLPLAVAGVVLLWADGI